MSTCCVNIFAAAVAYTHIHAMFFEIIFKLLSFFFIWFDKFCCINRIVLDKINKVGWNLPRVLMAKNRVKLLLNMLLLAAQAIPRGGQITVDPVGEGDTIGFKLSVTGTNAKIPQAIPPLLAATTDHAIDAHAIQPFYTGMLAKNCGLSVSMVPEGEAIVVAAK